MRKGFLYRDETASESGETDLQSESQDLQPMSIVIPSAEEAEASTADKFEEFDTERKDIIAEPKSDSCGLNQLESRSDTAAEGTSRTADAALQETRNIQLASEAAREAIKEVEKVNEDEVFPEQQDSLESSAADGGKQAEAESSPQGTDRSEEGIAGSIASEQISSKPQPGEDSSWEAISSVEEGKVQEPAASASNRLKFRQEEATSSVTEEVQIKPSEVPRRRRKRVRRKTKGHGREDVAERTTSSNSSLEKTVSGEAESSRGNNRIGELIQAETSTSDASEVRVRRQLKILNWSMRLDCVIFAGLLHEFVHCFMIVCCFWPICNI